MEKNKGAAATRYHRGIASAAPPTLADIGISFSDGEVDGTFVGYITHVPPRAEREPCVFSGSEWWP